MTTNTNQTQESQNKDFGLPNTAFRPLESGRRKWLKMTAIILGFLLMMGAGIFCWFFYYTAAPDLSGETSIYEAYTAGVPEEDVDTTEDHDTTVTYQTEAREALGEKATTPEQGIVTKLNTPQGYYYVIVGSFIDDDLASDYAYRLSKKGVHSILIAPSQGKYFYRVAISRAHTFSEANEKSTALQATYGTGIWVLKY